MRIDIVERLKLKADISGSVASIEGLTGAVTLSEGANITITPSGNDIEISAIGGGAPLRVVSATFDGQGSSPTVGTKVYVTCPFAGTITSWSIVSDVSGSAVVDVWKANGSIPTVANTIAGSEKPTLSSSQLNSDAALSSWTTAVVAGDVFGFNLDSASTLTRVTVEVTIQE